MRFLQFCITGGLVHAEDLVISRAVALRPAHPAHICAREAAGEAPASKEAPAKHDCTLMYQRTPFVWCVSFGIRLPLVVIGESRAGACSGCMMSNLGTRFRVSLEALSHTHTLAQIVSDETRWALGSPQDGIRGVDG